MACRPPRVAVTRFCWSDDRPRVLAAATSRHEATSPPRSYQPAHSARWDFHPSVEAYLKQVHESWAEHDALVHAARGWLADLPARDDVTGEAFNLLACAEPSLTERYRAWLPGWTIKAGHDEISRVVGFEATPFTALVFGLEER